MAGDPQRRERIAGAVRIAVPAVVVIGLGFAIWRFASDTTGERREVPPVPVVALAPPPPPPPPQTPPKPKPAEPEKVVEAPSPTPKSEAPKNDAPKQLTIAGPAQAGADAFGVKAGDGGGRSVGGDPNGSEDGGGGGGFAEAAYRRLLAQALQAAIQSDDEASRLAFTAQVRVWVLPDGRIDRVAVVRSSGDARVDRTVVAALMQAGRLEAPPPQLKFPALVALRGRRA